MSTHINRKKKVRAKLTILMDGHVESTYLVRDGERALLGRGDACDIVLEGAGISRQHTAFEVRGDGLYVTDLDSLNGTFVGQYALSPQVPTLHLGEPIVIGRYTVDADVTGLRNRAKDERGGSSQAFKLPPVPREEFEILGLLGQGATATVWAAKQRFLDRRVAIKVLRADMSEEDRQRLLQEAQLYCRFSSPRILNLHDVRLVEGALCLILELVQGATAGDWLASRRRMQVPEALRIGADVAEALTLLAEAGIVHRDIKPHNVLISGEGRAKVGDFGIAKVVNSAGLTGSNVGLGTLAYVAPEQAAAASEVGPPADIYALGATLFELLTSQPPLRLRGSMSERLRRIEEDVPPRVKDLRPEITPSVDTLVGAMLAKQPEDRPPADQVRRILEQVLADEYPNYRASFEETDTRAVQRRPLEGL